MAVVVILIRMVSAFEIYADKFKVTETAKVLHLDLESQNTCGLTWTTVKILPKAFFWDPSGACFTKNLEALTYGNMPIYMYYVYGEHSLFMRESGRLSF